MEQKWSNVLREDVKERINVVKIKRSNNQYTLIVIHILVVVIYL